jgi:hypothetical protein
VNTDLLLTQFIRARLADTRATAEPRHSSGDRRELAELAAIERVLDSIEQLPGSAQVDHYSARDLRRLFAAKWNRHPGYKPSWAFDDVAQPGGHRTSAPWPDSSSAGTPVSG